MAQKEHYTPCTMIKLKVAGIGCNESGEMNLKVLALGSQEIDSRLIDEGDYVKQGLVKTF